MPKKFDENEWFLLVCLVICYVIMFRLPRRFPPSITVLFLLIGPTIGRLFDHLLATAKLDLYNLMDTPNFDFFDLIIYFLYAPFSYMFLYFYDKWNIKGYWILLYLLLCTFFSGLFEWINQVFHVFTYKGWKLSYSFGVYLGVQSFVLLFYHLLMSYTNRRRIMEKADSN